MRALLCETLGPPSASLFVRDIDPPSAGAADVIVDVIAAGVNFPDLLIVQGLYQMKPPLPFSPGGEIAGVVGEIGANVRGIEIGARVMAFTGIGAFAERVVISPAQCVVMPEDMSFEIGAS